MSKPDVPNTFDPLRASEQPRALIPGYVETPLRNPARARIRRPLTLTEVTGPLNISNRARPGTGDMARSRKGLRALGPMIHLSGRVLDEDGRPLKRTILEIWHANASGKYQHESDSHEAPLDKNFPAGTRIQTDDRGRWTLVTIKPGPYPVPTGSYWWRPPHIHFSVFGQSSLSRLVTQMYFPGEPLNQSDLLLNSIPDRKARERLIARALPIRSVPIDNATGYVFDLVIRGHRQTPFIG